MAVPCARLGTMSTNQSATLVPISCVTLKGKRTGCLVLADDCDSYFHAIPQLSAELRLRHRRCRNAFAALLQKNLQCEERKGRALALAMTTQDASVEVSEDGMTSSGTSVKVCGVTTANDAVLAAEAGANFIGMILWPKAKRSVSFDVAAEIARVAIAHNAEPVGVFVDEDAQTITSVCKEVGITIAQLHGDKARAALPDLPDTLRVIYVLQADEAGKIKTPLPPYSKEQEKVDWFLIDGMVGGSGTRLDWANLEVPQGISRSGWLLAGGLNPDNVAEAIGILHPPAVDVSSGVTMGDGIAKDPARVVAFITAAKRL